MTAGRARRCRETGWWLTNVSRLWNLGSPVWWLCPLVLTTEGLPGGSVMPPFSSHPFPPGLCSPLLLLSALFSSPPRGVQGLQSSEIKKFRHASHFYTPPPPNLWKRSWQVPPPSVGARLSCWAIPSFFGKGIVAFLWKSLHVVSLRVERTKQSHLGRAWDVFCWAECAEGLGTALYIWQIDFCQQLSSVRLPVFEEEDQICGSMLCAGWTPKCT